MFGMRRGDQPKAPKPRWAEVGASAPRANQTEYIIAAVLVAFLLVGLALLLGWRP
jgi:hypothetical protein